MKSALDKGINIYSNIFFVIAIIMALFAVFVTPFKGEAPIGEFNTVSANEGWELTIDGEPKGTVNLPYRFPEEKDSIAVISKVCPLDVNDGMNLNSYAKNSFLKVYVDGELRGSYGYGFLWDSGIIKTPGAANIITPLYRSDAGKEIRLEYHLKGSKGIYMISVG